VVGPTATGKSVLADALAASLGGEVLNADSMQVERGMDIGTAKLPAQERSVPYHGIDLVDPGFPFTAALYQRQARAVIEALRAHGVPPVLCGGTGLYIRAALDDFRFDEGREQGEKSAPSAPATVPTSAAVPAVASAAVTPPVPRAGVPRRASPLPFSSASA
jgi:tRNA dimethylallyltransferase